VTAKCFPVNRRHKGTYALGCGYTGVIMRPRGYNFVGLVLSMLLFGLSVMPTPGRAEAQMRCVGASPHSAPCARAELPAAGLTEKQIDGMMACCRVMRGCSLPHASARSAVRGTVTTPSSLSASFLGRRCLVSIHFPVGAPAPAVFRTRWFLTAPALAPPTAAHLVLLPMSLSPAFSPYSSILPPHTLPHIHGLRAPPAA